MARTPWNWLRQRWRQMTGVAVSQELSSKRLFAGGLVGLKPLKRASHRSNRCLCAQPRQIRNRLAWRRDIWLNFRYNLNVADGRLRMRCPFNMERLLPEVPTKAKNASTAFDS